MLLEGLGCVCFIFRFRLIPRKVVCCFMTSIDTFIEVVRLFGVSVWGEWQGRVFVFAVTSGVVGREGE